MKYIFCSDNHLCTTSSVLTKRGEIFSSRLENQIDSLKWVNSFKLPVIHGGDFFNRDILDAEEISCVREICKHVDFNQWTFIQGNHGYSGGFDVMNIFPNQIITKPTEFAIGAFDDALLLPFRSTEQDIKKHYTYIFGHIGIEGIPFGAKGFNPDFIKDRCDYFINGHLHNKVEFRKNCWNAGSLTAQNFSDECTNAEKGIWIIDTESKSLDFIENPYAFNFYKMDYKQAVSYDFHNLSNACLSVTCDESQVDELRDKLSSAYYLRLNIQKKKSICEVSDAPKISVDYLDKFRKSYIAKNGESKYILEELAEVTK